MTDKTEALRLAETLESVMGPPWWKSCADCLRSQAERIEELEEELRRIGSTAKQIGGERVWIGAAAQALEQKK